MTGWAALGALADVACGMAIALGAGLVGYGLARRLHRGETERFAATLATALEAEAKEYEAGGRMGWACGLGHAAQIVLPTVLSEGEAPR